MRITFVISRLLAGGVERVLVNLTKVFSEKGHSVSVVTLYNKNTKFYDLPHNVKQDSLNLQLAPKGVFQKISFSYMAVRDLRKMLVKNKPDVIISLVNTVNILVLLSLIGKDIPVIVSEHNDPRKNPPFIFWKILRRLVYPKAQSLVSVNRHIQEYFSWMPKTKSFIIPNPITPLTHKSGQSIFSDTKNKHIIAMGEFEKVKGFDILIRAFSKISARNQDWDLWIIGDGPERGNLERLIKNLKLTNVFLPGRLINPFPTLKESHMFVLSSLTESFGNALIEAMACGLPVITTDCDGPKEIITDGINGKIVPVGDIDRLAIEIDGLVKNPTRQKNFSQQAKESVKKYEIEKVYASWQKIIPY